MLKPSITIEMHISTIIRSCYTCTHALEYLKLDWQRPSVSKNVEQLEPLCITGRSLNGIIIVEYYLAVLIMLNIHPSHDPAIQFLAFHPREMNNK